MTKQEFAQWAMALKTYYPKESLLPNTQAMELWFRQLEDVPYQVAVTALNKWVATNKWSPTIADIRETTATITTGELPDWGEAWEQVLTAIKRYGMYRADEALASLPELTRDCVRRLGFREICVSENITQDRANFRMIYEQLATRKKQQAQIPESVLKMIGSIQGVKMLE